MKSHLIRALTNIHSIQIYILMIGTNKLKVENLIFNNKLKIDGYNNLAYFLEINKILIAKLE